MGRPRKSKLGDPTILSFQANAKLIEELDTEAARMAQEFGVKVSRADLVRKILQGHLDKKRAK